MKELSLQQNNFALPNSSDFTFGLSTCNLKCEIAIFVQLFVLMSHYLHNLGALRGWAGGNFFLVTNTAFTTLMTFVSIATLLGMPEWFLAPYRTRFIVFILSFASTIVFTSSLIGTFTVYFKND